MGLTQTLLSVALLLILVVGIHGGGRVGGELYCNTNGGKCINPFIEDGPFCYKNDQINVTEKNIERECGSSEYICCKKDKIQDNDRVGIGYCNNQNGRCINPSIEDGPFCYKKDQIDVTEINIERECGNSEYICCEKNKIQYPGNKRNCHANIFHTRRMKRRIDPSPPVEDRIALKKYGCKCKADCDTMQIDGLCQGAGCTCCVEKAKKCKPNAEHEDKDGFCVRKAKHCSKNGGILIKKGCDCKKKKGHMCVMGKLKG